MSDLDDKLEDLLDAALGMGRSPNAVPILEEAIRIIERTLDDMQERYERAHPTPRDCGCLRCSKWFGFREPPSRSASRKSVYGTVSVSTACRQTGSQSGPLGRVSV